MNYNDIINKVGTPTYIFDVEELLKRIDYLKSKFKTSNIVYAVKANTFITKELENSVDRFEICSPGEFEICKDLNIEHKKMVISGVYKDNETIENMISNFENIGKYTIESISQWKLLTKLVKKYNKKINVLIRLTSGNQFGVSEEDLNYILDNNDNNYISIEGIEYFSGTQKHSIKRIEKEINYLIEVTNRLESEKNIKVKEIEYGPGLPIFYFQGDEFDEDTFLTEINELLNKIPFDKTVSLEIGRSIAACCGTYLTQVVDMKENKNGKFVIVDGGINHLVYYGGIMGMRTPHFEVYPKRNEKIINYNIYGSLCTINDILMKNININELQIGDIFIFKNTGAYSSTEGISLFLSRNLPKIVILDKNKNIKVVRETTKTSTLNFPNY